MKIISFNDIKGLQISPLQCLEWAKFILMNKYNCTLPPKISMKMENDIFVNTMPSFIPTINRYGVKIVSRYPLRTPSLISEIALYDSLNGETLALMDGTWITAMRTGAVAALSIQTFQKKDAYQYAFLGLGNTARATLLCLSELYKKKELHINLLAYKGQEKIFIERFKEYSNLKFQIYNNTEELINDSDVIISCITATNSLIAPDECFKEGVTLIPVHTRGFQNCDLFFDKIYADDTAHVNNFKYFNLFKYFNEVSKVLINEDLGRTSNTERILVYNIGISLHDIYFASQIYDLITNDTQNKKLFTENKKFWL